MTATVRNPKIDSAHQSASDPAVDGVEFDGTADVTLATYSRAVFIAADGNLQVTMIGLPGSTGATLTFTGVKGGTVLPICITSIVNAGTTCSGVVLY